MLKDDEFPFYPFSCCFGLICPSGSNSRPAEHHPHLVSLFLLTIKKKTLLFPLNCQLLYGATYHRHLFPSVSLSTSRFRHGGVDCFSSRGRTPLLVIKLPQCPHCVSVDSFPLGMCPTTRSSDSLGAHGQPKRPEQSASFSAFSIR